MSLIFLLTLLGVTPSPVLAAEISQYTVEYSTTTAPFILQAIATKHGIDPEPFIATAKCESGFKANAIGDHGTSFGVYQIHLPAHPYITKEQAMDPWFAAEWAAARFAEGKQNWWTCHRMLYGRI